jgi:drug/metabolite transporter (DMT)-like permease
MFFSCQDAMIKLLAGDYSVLQILFMRSAAATPALAVFLYWRHGLEGFKTRRGGMHLMRCLCVLAAFICFYSAVTRLPLADVVALFTAAPLFITALAGPLLGETVGLRRWCAVAVGFVGVVIMLRPGSGLFEPLALLAAAAAVFYAASALLSRAMGPGEPGGLIGFYSNVTFLIGCGGGLLLVTVLAQPASGPVSPIGMPYITPSTGDFVMMLMIGFITLFGFILVPRAYQIAPASAVTPFEYTYLLWAMLIGYFLFDEVPTATTLLGAGLVVAAGVYIARREAMLASRRAAPIRA